MAFFFWAVFSEVVLGSPKGSPKSLDPPASAHEFSVQSLVNGQNSPDLAKGIGPCPSRQRLPCASLLQALKVDARIVINGLVQGKSTKPWIFLRHNGGVQHVTVNSPSTSIDGTNFTHFTYQILSNPMNISTSTQCLELSTINRPPNSWDEKSADCCTKLRNSRICCSPEPGNPETLRDRVCLKIGLRALKMAIYIYLCIKNIIEY
jgi:hypothetical protein